MSPSLIERQTTRPPKKMFRLLESSYADLSASSPPEFFGRALERTRDRFGDECEIERYALFERDGAEWALLTGDPSGLSGFLDGANAEERGTLHSSGIIQRDHPFPTIVWLLGSRREFAAVLRLERAPGAQAALILKMAHMAIQQRAQEADWTGMLDRARTIQRSLIPEPFPGLAGFDVFARSDPAEDVGGDIFDGISLPPDALGLLVADASGHGLAAALEARDVVIGLRMGATRDLKIQTTIERLNRILCGSAVSSRFVSLVYGELDTEGAFDYVNAGHPAPLLLSESGSRTLPESGPALGVLAGSLFRVGHAEIPPGGTLLIYTDGVTECLSPHGDEFGLSRLEAMTRALGQAPAAVLCTAVFEALAEHAAGVPFPDDASLLVVKRLPDPPAEFFADSMDSTQDVPSDFTTVRKARESKREDP